MADTKPLIIVESPAKARTIAKFLGPDYVVESSIGHIRDLPPSAAEIPKQYKGKPWARLGINVDNDFEPLYIVPQEKKKQVATLKKKLAGASELYLATDEDREGEAIAWHLVEVLKPKVPVKRMVFHEITDSAIAHALQAPRDIDKRLVAAQETRRILDRLVGYEVSPVLWKKLRPKLSAGRVQSVATRLIVAREKARMRFVESAFCGLEATLKKIDEATAFTAKLAELDGSKVAIGKDFDPETGELKTKALVLDHEQAHALAGELGDAEFTVSEVNEKPFTNRPYPPFMTSTLQQEAGRKLRFNARRTMRIAQSLYENGYITYMRTDSLTLSREALSAARHQVRELYGNEYLPDQPRVYRSKSKSAQEAHEAIRPAGDRFRTPASLRSVLEADQFKLYDLIWKRTMASQMKDALGVRTQVRIEAPTAERGMATFATSGKVITFAGFLRAYVAGSDDPEAELADQEKILPQLSQGEALDVEGLEPSSHTTQPPARYTEASLVKELEARGIGRPSTYASIIQTIQDRGYVWNKSQALVPTFTAFAVTRLLERNLPDLVDYDFTARMEDELDAIALGESEAAPWLNDFYFGVADADNGRRQIMRMGLRALVASGENIEPREASRITIGQTPDGERVVVRVGRYGPYIQIGESEVRASIPDDMPPDELTLERALEMVAKAAEGDKVLGKDPATGKPVYVKSGRFGPYIQLGEREDGGDKPKMASLWKSMEPETVTLEQAVMLLSFPREVGPHPETGEIITVQDGRYGPYVKMGAETRSLESQEQLATITLDEAVAKLKEPKRGRGSGAASVIADLGTHPENGEKIQVKNGRFGPYVTDGTVNATVPKGSDPEKVDLEQAVELLARREEKLRSQGKDPRAKKTRKPARKKAAKKK
ncbi:MAG: type I DNA topoisomerase [Acidobacteriota bacterium]|nr:type I DNA topoisomerase [Acidobacteriota bacterium]